MNSNSHYSIKAAAQMADLSVDTLRAWERRYRAVEPTRSETGRRRYTDAEVERLSLLKQATDLGHPISMVAPLANDELRELLAKQAELKVRESELEEAWLGALEALETLQGELEGSA